MDASIIWNVTMSIKVQEKTHGRFSIPKKVCDALGLGSGDEFQAVIANGSRTIYGKFTLVSGNEVVASQGSDLYEIAPPSADLTVAICRVSK